MSALIRYLLVYSLAWLTPTWAKDISEDIQKHAIHPTIHLATANPEMGNFYPILYFENEQVKGQLIERISCAFKLMAFPVEIITLPWARTWTELEQGRVDAIFPATATPQSLSVGQLSESMLTESLLLISNKPNIFHYPGTVQLGMVRGTYVDKQLLGNLKFTEVKVNNYQQLFNMLSKDRVDAVLSYNIAYQEFNKQHQSTLLFKQTLTHFQISVLFGNEFLAHMPQMLALFNQSLRMCLTEPTDNIK